MRATLAILVLIFGVFAGTSRAAAGLEEYFLACLDDYNGAELPCLEKLGGIAWMPWNDTTCEIVASRIEAIVAAGGLVRHPDLFRNERCARLNRPHNKDAAAAGSPKSPDRAYVECFFSDRMVGFGSCEDIVGDRKWHPLTQDDCPAGSKLTAMQHKTFRNRSWRSLFYNERCRRLGQEYFVPDESYDGGINLGPE